MHFCSFLLNVLPFSREGMQAEQRNLRPFLMWDKFCQSCHRSTHPLWAQRGSSSRLSLLPSFQKGPGWPATDVAPFAFVARRWAWVLSTSDANPKTGVQMGGISLAFTDEAARGLKLLQYRHKMIALIPKNFSSVAFIGYLRRGLAL